MNHKTLPPGYQFAGIMDFTRNRKQMIAVFKLALALFIIPLIAGIVFRLTVKHEAVPFVDWWYLIPATAAMWVVYIPLHELTHGAVMFALSGVKPKFGIQLPYAYAGSDVWFDRRSHIVTALAPVALWGIVLQILINTLPPRWFWPLWLTQISNLSGSAGDIYCVWVLLRMKGDLLIQDTGTRMRIMRKNKTAR